MAQRDQIIDAFSDGMDIRYYFAFESDHTRRIYHTSHAQHKCILNRCHADAKPSR
jgi:hypothetical protein